MKLEFVVIFLVGVSLSSCIELAKVNKTTTGTTATRKYQRDWYGPSYKPKGWDPKLHTMTRSDTHFGYEPPEGSDTWQDKFPECGGERQSPINLPSKDLVSKLTRTPLSFSNYGTDPFTLEVENSGHSIHLTGEWDDGDEPVLTGGPLIDGEYSFSQLHFHWGKDDSRGSEHTINHKRYPCEMHVVHSRRGDVSVNPFEEVPDDIAVVGFMCEIQDRDNPAFAPLLDVCQKIGRQPSKTKIRPFPISKLLREFGEDYVTYEGSLTTPPCSENVKWIVSSKSIRLSRSQVRQLRQCIGLPQNYRSVQKRYDRTLYYLTV